MERITYTRDPCNEREVREFVGETPPCGMCGGTGEYELGYGPVACQPCNSRCVPYLDATGKRRLLDWGETLERRADGLHPVVEGEQHRVWILWGRPVAKHKFAEPDRVREYCFATNDELNAFLTGVSEAIGFEDHEQFDSQEDVDAFFGDEVEREDEVELEVGQTWRSSKDGSQRVILLLGNENGRSFLRWGRKPGGKGTRCWLTQWQEWVAAHNATRIWTGPLGPQETTSDE